MESISGAREFRRVFRTSRRFGAPPIEIYVAARTDPDAAPRLGLAVKGRRAIDRNRMKRRVRAAVRQTGVPRGTDVVVRADGSAPEVEFQELVKRLSAALPGGVRSA